MERYGCLIIGVVVALIVLVGIVYLWSGWLNRPVGRAPAASTYSSAFSENAGIIAPQDTIRRILVMMEVTPDRCAKPHPRSIL